MKDEKPSNYKEKPGNPDKSRLPGLVEVRGIEPHGQCVKTA